LQRLRLILGDGKTPLSQADFATRIGMSVATVRGIEGGRRPFSKHCQKQILATLTATWDPRKRAWFLLRTNEPYQKEYQYFIRLLDPDDRYLEDLSVHMLIERLLMLFDACTESPRRFALLLYLSEHLQETAHAFELQVNLGPNEPIWHRGTDLNLWGKTLRDTVLVPIYEDEKGARRYISPHQNAGGIFDFRSWRTFRTADYPEGKTPENPANAALSKTLLQFMHGPELTSPCGAQEMKVQTTTGDRKPKPEKSEILTGPIPDQNGNRHKTGSSEKVSEKP
jgi:transcriptional regulator with XRE-family HTH domain